MNDYTELPLYLEQGEIKELWVYFSPTEFIVIKDVCSDPVRYEGWWTIPFVQYNRYVSAHIEASKVMYFVTIDKDDVNAFSSARK